MATDFKSKLFNLEDRIDYATAAKAAEDPLTSENFERMLRALRTLATLRSKYSKDLRETKEWLKKSKLLDLNQKLERAKVNAFIKAYLDVSPTVMPDEHLACLYILLQEIKAGDFGKGWVAPILKKAPSHILKQWEKNVSEALHARDLIHSSIYKDLLNKLDEGSVLDVKLLNAYKGWI